MNFKQLEAFVKVAELGSFSKAAKELYLTQPTVSAHISALEKELDVRLFVRNTKEVTLSEAGKELYKYAKKIMELSYQISEHFSVKGREEVQSIRIAASTIPAQYLLPELLNDFKKKYPEEKFQIFETDSTGVTEKIVNGTVDLGFTGSMIEKKHCAYIPFYKDRLTIVTPNTEKYRKLKSWGSDNISWLKDEFLILREGGSGTRKEAAKQLKVNGIILDDLNIVAQIDNQETIKRSVRQGVGVTLLSELATKDEVARGELITFDIPKSGEGRSICLVYNKNIRISKSVKRFLNIVKEAYQL